MIRRDDLLEAIAECQGQRNPNATTCIKLAAYYTILDHLEEDEEDTRDMGRSFSPLPQYSLASGQTEEIIYESESDFAGMIYGLKQQDVFAVIDELMSTVKILNPRLYDGVMRKLDGLH